MRRALTVTGRLTTKRRNCGSHVVIALLGAVLQGVGNGMETVALSCRLIVVTVLWCRPRFAVLATGQWPQPLSAATMRVPADRDDEPGDDEPGYDYPFPDGHRIVRGNASSRGKLP